MKISRTGFPGCIVVKISMVMLLFTAEVFPAEVPDGAMLSVAQAIDLSLKNNSQYKISLEKVSESRLKIRESWGAIWPQLSTDVSYSRMYEESGLSSGVQGRYDVKFITGRVVLNPGVFYHNLQASYNARVAAENELRAVRADIVTKTIQLYYQMLLADEMIKLRVESISALEENLRVADAGYRKGMLSRLDVLRARVSLSNENTRLINAQNDLLSLKAALNIHMGRDIDEAIAVGDGAYLTGFAAGEYNFGDGASEHKLVAEMIACALRNRPELLQIKIEKDSAGHAAKSLESAYLWPSFYVSGNYGMSKSVAGNSDDSGVDPAYAPFIKALSAAGAPRGWNTSWSVSFGAAYSWGTLAPFDPAHARASQLKSVSAQIDLRFEEFVKQVKLEVQQKFLKLKASSASINSQRGNVETAEESLRVSVTQFKSGIIDSSKLLEANVELATAKTLYVQAFYDYQLSRAELNRAMGCDYFDIR